VDPSDANWVNGPQVVGGGTFVLPMPGGASWNYTPGQMSDLSKLDYNYDDVSPPAGTLQVVTRLQRVGGGK
jgi:tyrosinase